MSEAVTKAVVGALKAAPGADNTDDWLNPTEVVDDVYTISLIAYLHELNLRPPRLGMAACAAAQVSSLSISGLLFL